MAQRGVVAQRGQHGVAVHLGHDDVEEDDVDGRLDRVTQPIERLPPVACFDRLVSDALQQPREELAVELGVVDDEDAAGPHGAVAGGWRHARSPAARAGSTARASAASSSSGRIGLLT